MDSGLLLGGRFRLNSAFRIVSLTSLSAADRQLVGEVRPGPDVEFVLIPSRAGPSAKVVDARTAGVLRSFVDPRTFDASDWNVIPREPASLARLVLDGVLELELGDRFVSGPSAGVALALDNAPPEAADACAVGSMAALAYGARLDHHEPALISKRLYQYGRQPVSPSWRAGVEAAGGALAWLGLEQGGRSLERAEQAWGPGRTHEANPEWLFFRRGGFRDRRLKLYVAPDPAALSATLPGILATFARHNVQAFKVARTAAAVRRPDKVVAYLDSREQVTALADGLAERLAGTVAQPVPFSAALDPAGLTSWGVDPPSHERVSHQHGLSWRRWVTDRLAVALVSARADGVASPVEFARQRIRLEGVDPATWAPTGLSWVEESR